MVTSDGQTREGPLTTGAASGGMNEPARCTAFVTASGTPAGLVADGNTPAGLVNAEKTPAGLVTAGKTPAGLAGATDVR